MPAGGQTGQSQNRSTEVVMSSLSAPGQARSLCHRQTATSKKLWNFKI